MKAGADVHALHRDVLAWYSSHGRDLPWRRTRDPYALLVAEVMLQQTGVDRVVPKYQEFLTQFPSFEALATSPTAEVIRAWGPLGYNRRAVNLQRAAQVVVQQWSGALPRDPDQLRQLPGVGPYTAAALVCFAFGEEVVVLDTNIQRVLSRVVFGVVPAEREHPESAAQSLVPRGRASPWHQALMDIGATLCAVSQPRCGQCPLRPHCAAAPHLQNAPRRVAEASVPYKAPQSPFRESRRYYRGRIVEALCSIQDGRQGIPLAQLGERIKSGFTVRELPWLLDLLRHLEGDGLVRLRCSQGDIRGEGVTVSLP